MQLAGHCLQHKDLSADNLVLYAPCKGQEQIKGERAILSMFWRDAGVKMRGRWPQGWTEMPLDPWRSPAEATAGIQSVSSQKTQMDRTRQKGYGRKGEAFLENNFCMSLRQRTSYRQSGEDLLADVSHALTGSRSDQVVAV
ncbi:hypothetical protein ElyMa_004552400 [Elysia marginata]|uniref:Protein kinase domain-containing protein n=1 Tax=Elysia marginata TaxID=1093978 RepID=A0AAV4HUF1_9GAST|nr:hypothetical protein ElyMa_004552400 [Elysia marginata]